MRWLYRVCIKSKHVKFMNEKPSVLSLGSKYTYTFLPPFHLDFIENLNSSQPEKSGATFSSMTSCLLFLIIKLSLGC